MLQFDQTAHRSSAVSHQQDKNTQCVKHYSTPHRPLACTNLVYKMHRVVCLDNKKHITHWATRLLLIACAHCSFPQQHKLHDEEPAICMMQNKPASDMYSLDNHPFRRSPAFPLLLQAALTWTSRCSSNASGMLVWTPLSGHTN